MKVGLAIATGILVLAIVTVFAGQRALLFPAPRPPRTPAPELGELLHLPSTVALWSPPGIASSMESAVGLVMLMPW